MGGTMQLWQKALYWGVAGALVGLGALRLGSFLQILFFPGIALLIYRTERIGADGIWAVPSRRSHAVRLQP